jgi:hypothetical protein
MNNYDLMRQAAKDRFAQYDPTVLLSKSGITDGGAYLNTTFFGKPVAICKESGEILVGGSAANFSEALSIYDWLCDRKDGARSSGIFCPVNSLPGVYVSGKGLVISGGKLSQMIQQNPKAFRQACCQMGAIPLDMGDMGYRIPVFPDLSMCLKFYFADEEFPPQLTFLWDRNVLQFVRYETVYYLAGCLSAYLQDAMTSYIQPFVGFI